MKRGLGCLGLLVAGCAVGPDYQRPELAVPDEWRVSPAELAETADPRWWSAFGDPVLTALVEEAALSNRDALIAAARVEQFAGALTSTRAGFFPQFDYGGDASRGRSSQNGAAGGTGSDPYFDLYQGSVGVAWQLDLFGQIRRLAEADRARLLASVQARRGVLLTVVANTTATYVALLGEDRRLQVARQTADNYAKTLRIFRMRHERGVASRTEVAQIESQYQQALATIPALEERIANLENLLCILLGRPPGPIERGAGIDALILPPVPAGLPATLLEQRPDVTQAEQNLVAANAELGFARSLYFPSFAITGSYGAASSDLGDFLDAPSRSWNLGLRFAGPIFSAGRIGGQVQTAEAARAAAILDYRATVDNAFREVNDALVGAEKTRAVSEALTTRAEALADYARLARMKFDRGVTGYLEVLYAENELFGALLAAVQAEVDQYSRLIDTYRAMGGDWVDEIEGLAPAPAKVVEAN